MWAKSRVWMFVVVPGLLLGAVIGMGWSLAGLGAAVLFVGALWLFWSSPEHLIWLPLACLMVAPWQRIEPFRSQIAIYPVAWAVLAVCAVLIVRGRFSVSRSPAAILGLLVAGWAILGLALGHGAYVQSGRWIITWLLGYLTACLLCTEGAAWSVISRSWLAALALGSFTILEWLLKSNPIFGGLVSVVRDDTFLNLARFRPSGTVGHPLVVADIIGMLIVLTIAGWRLGRVRSVFAYVGASVGVVALVATGSRGALIVTALAVAAALVVEWRPTTRDSLIAAAVLGMTAIVALTMLPFVEARFSGALASSSFAQRLASLAAAADVARVSPWFGEGAGMANLAMLRLGFGNFSYETEYAGALIGLGFPGLLAISAMPIISVWEVYARKSDRVVRPLSLSLGIYALGIIGTHNVFDWWLGPIIFWVCVTIAHEARLQLGEHWEVNGS